MAKTRKSSKLRKAGIAAGAVGLAALGGSKYGRAAGKWVGGKASAGASKVANSSAGKWVSGKATAVKDSGFGKKVKSGWDKYRGN